jgi:lipoyl(octanoyl) transferase
MQKSAHDWQAPRQSTLAVHLLGLVDFDACAWLQDRLAIEIGHAPSNCGALLVCEHPPLITVGREGSRSNISASDHELGSREIDVRWVNRGGGCVVHAPGQLALYPIVPLDRLGLGLAEYRSRLELALVDLCRELQVAAWRNQGEAGLWCRGGRVAQVGVAIRGWVSKQGLYVNVNPRPDLTGLVSEDCGPVTSLSAERRLPTSMATVRESLVRRLAARLGYEQFHLCTGHRLLVRRRRVVAYA